MEMPAREHAGSDSGPSLYQDEFFFCTVEKFGDLPATGCIHVEVVADRESGVVFAKVYPQVSALNAVDILATRVLPYFERRGTEAKEIHTPRKSQYRGRLLVHPYETFLAASHIEHLPLTQHGNTYFYFCEQFYWFLLKEFFQPALRRKFHLTLEALQGDLDKFVEAYNAMQLQRANRPHHEPIAPLNFPVDV